MLGGGQGADVLPWGGGGCGVADRARTCCDGGGCEPKNPTWAGAGAANIPPGAGAGVDDPNRPPPNAGAIEIVWARSVHNIMNMIKNWHNNQRLHSKHR